MPVRFLIVLVLCGACGNVLAQETPVAGSPSAKMSEVAARIARLIQELGDEKFDVREAADKALSDLGGRARPALEEATKSTDAEIASRAKAILDRLPKFTHTLADALGQPIPNAAVSVSYTETEPAGTTPLPVLPMVEDGARPAAGPGGDRAAARATVTMITEEDGRFAIPEGAADVRIVAQHMDYGRAQCEVDVRSEKTIVQLPLVRRGTEAHKRALTGQIVDADGNPVAGAAIQCSDVRTPGEGLVEGVYPRGDALSDDEGRFTFYLPASEVRQSERGVLIPANSRYGLQVLVPGDDSFFPWSGRPANTEPVRIELARANRLHKFRFAAAGGGWIEDPQQLRNVRVQFDKLEQGERILVDMGPEIATKGRKLIAGKYVAEAFLNGKTLQYLPLEVTEVSPEVLSFALPQAVTYRGRVVHGVTGEAKSGALVIAYNSTSRNNLALLTAEDWKLLRETPANPPLDHPAIVRLNEFYGVQGFVRAGDDGKFAITRQPDQEFYGLIAFDEDAVPYSVSVGSMKANEEHQIDVGEFPLFPAARILVNPVFAGDRLAVCPRWYPEAAGQPEWFSRYQAAIAKSWERQFEYVHWLTINELQPVFVPAGIRLQIAFESPYNDQWAPFRSDTIQLEAKSTKEIGEVHFKQNMPVSVRVVDASGKPVEGAPIRLMHKGDDGWSVAHNTDGDGLAKYFVRHGSEGWFRLSDLPGPREVQEAANLKTTFKVGDAPPPEPFQIKMTAEQAELLLGAKKLE